MPVSATVSGLRKAEVRSFRLVVVSGAGVRVLGNGMTISQPRVNDEHVVNVGSEAATVTADIDAGGLPSSTCYYAYIESSEDNYEKETNTECDIAEEETFPVTVELTGLRPGVTYQTHLVASNVLGTKNGETLAFTAFDSNASALPDGRVYEAVSSLEVGDSPDAYVPAGMETTLDDMGRHGIDTALPMAAAPDGETVTYLGDPPATGGNGDEGDGGGNQYVARRSPTGGWNEISVNAPSYANDYVAFSGDLAAGVLGSSEVLAAGAPEGDVNLYRRTIGWDPTATGVSEPRLGAPEPLITAPPQCEAREFGAELNGNLHEELLVGGGDAGNETATEAGDIPFEANAALPGTTPEATRPEGCGGENDLYDWVGGKLYLVNILPGGEVNPGATFGRQGPSTNGFVSPETSNAASAGGSRIYWSTVKEVKVGGEYEEQPQALYLRENDTRPESPIEESRCTVRADACTIQVDLPEPGVGGAGGEGQFWTASGDGARVFFTDEQPLTASATAAPGAPDLYEYDLEAPEEQRLSDLSVPPASGGPADVQGVIGASEDGSYVYFVADGVLTRGDNAEGRAPVEGQPNLYLRHQGTTTFVATLAPGDGDFTAGVSGNDGDWQADPGHRTAEVTPDGHSLVFMSRMPLTGYDSALENVALTEVFVYNAETGRLACASCDPSGEPPVAPSLPEFSEHIAGIWGSFLPVSDSLVDYQPRLISEDGNRVFFDSIEPLVPQDKNGFLDVYEWEADGESGCRDERGCIYLLSGGQSTDNSYLLDASADGDDVFFVSRAQLVRADHGSDDVLYDARVGGVEPPQEGTCAGAGCQGQPPAPPQFATPASVTFAGVGNFPPPAPTVTPAPRCARGKVRRQDRCVKPKAKKRKSAPRRRGRTRGVHGKRARRGGR